MASALRSLPPTGEGDCEAVEGLAAHPAPDVVKNGRQIDQHVSRGNAEDLNPTQGQPRRPAFVVTICIRVLVTLAVDFDRQLGLLAVEVEDIRPDRMLAAEAKSIQSPPSKGLPNQHLRQRQLTA